MPAPDTTCPKCRGPMEAGLLIDHSYGTTIQSTWMEGAPERSIWTGLRMKGRDRLRVTTYRCERCGYLESYATDPA